MARYIDADKLKERLEDFSRWCMDGRKQGVDFVLDCPLPAMLDEDVVPKSEVEATVEKLMSATDKVICEAKAEVAREIFGEIDILVDDYKHSNIQSIQFIAELAQLKKKYTG